MVSVHGLPNEIIDEEIRVIKSLPYIRDMEYGKMYDVPCVRDDFAEDHVPIIPLIHDDKEVGFPFLHIHYDFRVFYESELTRFRRQATSSRFAFVKVIRQGVKFVMERRVCLHKPGIPPDGLCGLVSEASKANLLDNTSNKKLLDAGICPHKGHKFSGASVRGCGKRAVLHCPLHGLKFKMATGGHLHCQKNG